MVEMIGDVAKLVRRIAGPPDRPVFVFSRRLSDPYTQLPNRLYAAASGRIGIEFEHVEVPPNTATVMSSGGLVDVP